MRREGSLAAVSTICGFCHLASAAFLAFLRRLAAPFSPACRTAEPIASSRSPAAPRMWYRSGVPPVPIRWLLVRDPKGELEPQAFLATNLNARPCDILAWFVSRWQVEVTFAEVRAHLGVETQRQWSDKAILRTTPVLLGLFSIVTLWAHDLAKSRKFKPRTTAWYPKAVLTFSDAIAAVRREIWHNQISFMSRPSRDSMRNSAPYLEPNGKCTRSRRMNRPKSS